MSEALSTAIAELEAEDRLILKLYYFDDLKLKDIAATFGYHEATASRKLTRVQTEIRKRRRKGLRERARLDRQRGKTPSERDGREPRDQSRNDVRGVAGIGSGARFVGLRRSVSGLRKP